jgi:hypothetical protein
MIKYTWKIAQLDCIPSVNGQTNVVSMVHWCANASNGANTAEVYGVQGLTFDAKNAFTVYSNLTKDQVVGWVQEAMGADAVTALQESLNNKLETLANPPIVSPKLPWSN